MIGTGTLLFVAGQIGSNGTGRMVSSDFVAQFAQALDNVLAVVREAGGEPTSVARLTIYVTDKDLYRSRLQDVGRAYRDRMGRHYPAMALLETRSLLEDEALVEIEATAVL
jgi:enamine deaminase RidA (YjgF/YER057c/UK114 family)